MTALTLIFQKGFLDEEAVGKAGKICTNFFGNSNITYLMADIHQGDN